MGPPPLLRTVRVPPHHQNMTPIPNMFSTDSRAEPSPTKRIRLPCLTQLEMRDSLDDFLGNVGLFAEMDMLIPDHLDTLTTPKIPDKINSDFTLVSVVEQTKHDVLGNGEPCSRVLSDIADSNDTLRTTVPMMMDPSEIPNPLRKISFKTTHKEYPTACNSQKVPNPTGLCNKADQSGSHIGTSLTPKMTRKRNTSSSPPTLMVEGFDNGGTKQEMLQRR